jgi:DNA-binding NtrC family response regulator
MRILLIGTLNDQLVTAGKIAKEKGAKVIHAGSQEQAMQYIREGQSIDAALIDVKDNIQEFINRLSTEKIILPVIACGVDATADAAAQAIEAGATEYLPLPPEEELIATVLEAITNQDTQNEIISRSSNFCQILQIARQIAPSNAGVLITGESGTGKEVMSRYIHNNSPRRNKDFIAVNCAAIPENLLESELFGHEKGAFTGAAEKRIGKFEQANGSTILLDEISEMDIKLQAKLLRVLQERELVRLGGTKPISLDIRVLATSNRDMMEQIRKGNFREDLYYRLNVITLELPPLRSRREDIIPLSNQFVDKYSQLNGVTIRKLDESAQKKLLAHSWPGNIRELDNTMHRAVLVATGASITADDILINKTSALDDDGISIETSGNTLAAIEQKAICDTLKRYDYNINKTASVLGVSIKLLSQKLMEYDL